MLKSSAVLATAWILVSTAGAQQPTTDLSRQVEVLRTAHGVPHIRAENLRAAAYGLAWVMLEDHGSRVVTSLLRARGEMGRWFGRDSMEGDFLARPGYRTAVDRYPQLDAATREVYAGWAAAANRYVATHATEFPQGFSPNFTGYDVAARDVGGAGLAAARRFLARVDPSTRRGAAATDASPGEGIDRLLAELGIADGDSQVIFMSATPESLA